MTAATELLAMGGPERVGVREICARAAASRAAFYECYADKYACVFDAYDRFVQVLLEALARAAKPSQQPWETYVATVIDAYVSVLQRDLVTARAFQLEMDGFGREARVRRRRALESLARLLQSRREETLGRTGPIAPYVAAVYGVRQMVSDALDDEDHPDLRALVPALMPWVARVVDVPEH
jgi:AcrR family transcriptional regulator